MGDDFVVVIGDVRRDQYQTARFRTMDRHSKPAIRRVNSESLGLGFFIDMATKQLERFTAADSPIKAIVDEFGLIHLGTMLGRRSCYRKLTPEQWEVINTYPELEIRLTEAVRELFRCEAHQVKAIVFESSLLEGHISEVLEMWALSHHKHFGLVGSSTGINTWS